MAYNLADLFDPTGQGAPGGGMLNPADLMSWLGGYYRPSLMGGGGALSPPGMGANPFGIGATPHQAPPPMPPAPGVLAPPPVPPPVLPPAPPPGGTGNGGMGLGGGLPPAVGGFSSGFKGGQQGKAPKGGAVGGFGSRY